MRRAAPPPPARDRCRPPQRGRSSRRGSRRSASRRARSSPRRCCPAAPLPTRYVAVNSVSVSGRRPWTSSPKRSVAEPSCSTSTTKRASSASLARRSSSRQPRLRLREQRALELDGRPRGARVGGDRRGRRVRAATTRCSVAAVDPQQRDGHAVAHRPRAVTAAHDGGAGAEREAVLLEKVVQEWAERERTQIGGQRRRHGTFGNRRRRRPRLSDRRVLERRPEADRDRLRIRRARTGRNRPARRPRARAPEPCRAARRRSCGRDRRARCSPTPRRRRAPGAPRRRCRAGTAARPPRPTRSPSRRRRRSSAGSRSGRRTDRSPARRSSAARPRASPGRRPRRCRVRGPATSASTSTSPAFSCGWSPSSVADVAPRGRQQPSSPHVQKSKRSCAS